MMAGVRDRQGRPRRPFVEKEADVQLACTQLLELDGWRALMTDPCSDRSRGKGFGEKGMADALYIRYRDPQVTRDFQTQLPLGAEAMSRAQVLWIEWKRKKDGRVRSNQDTWHTAERARGALTWVAIRDFEATIEGFWAHYQRSGLLRKEITVGALREARYAR